MFRCMSEQSHFKTQRRYPRHDVNIQVGVIHRLKYKLTYATQLSEGGMLVYSGIDYPVGEPVEIGFVLPPENKLVFVNGEIVYSFLTKNSFRYVGIRFVDITHRLQEQLRIFAQQPSL